MHRKSNKKIYIAFIIFLAAGFFSKSYSQQLPGQNNPEEEVQEWESDSLGRRTPRGTVAGFVEAVADRNYNRASNFLNIKPFLKDAKQREELVQKIQRLLDTRGNIMPYSWISDNFSGDLTDNLRPNLERIGSITLSGDDLILYVEEVKASDGSPVWLFSSETIKSIRNINLEDERLIIDKVLPEFLKTKYLGGVPVGHWILIIILAILSYLIARIIVLIIRLLLIKLWEKASTEPTEGIIKALMLPIRLFLAVSIFVYVSQEIGISIIVRQFFNELTVIISSLAFLILVWQLIDFISNFSQKKMLNKGHYAGLSLVLFIRRLAKILIVVIGLIAIFSSLGFDVTTGLAALGIGGIALALGAQKTVENFVGSVTLIADRPLRVGDFCKIGDTIGTVEQIGMRSTRLRTLDRTLVAIPNGELSSNRIENYAHRDKFRFTTILNMRYETTPDQIRYLLVEIRSVLLAHPKVNPDPARVRLMEFGASSLNIEIFTYIDAIDYNDFMEVREDLLLRIMDIVKASGSDFAFPSQTLYFAKDQGLPEEKAKEAAERVQQWRESFDLQIPKFHPDKIDELKGTIKYPPEGSAANRDE